MQVALEDPKRFRIELAFSRGADLSPLEVLIMSPLSFFFIVYAELQEQFSIMTLKMKETAAYFRTMVNLQVNDEIAASLHQEHTLPIMGPERLQEVGSYLTLANMEKLVRPFAMPAEDFPPPSTPQGFSGYFSKSASVLERLANIWPFHKHVNNNGK